MALRPITCASLGLLLTALIGPLLTKMPPPFDDVVAREIPLAHLSKYPGRSNGSTVPPQFSGAFTLNKRLRSSTRLFEGIILGSESVAVTPAGNLLMFDRQGFLHRAVPRDDSHDMPYELKQERVAYVGPGRPLGFHVVSEDIIYICCSLKGLLRLDLRTGSLEVLSNSVQASDNVLRPVHYANDLDVALDGTVYFTSSTDNTVARNVDGFYDTMCSYLLSLQRGEPDGSLLKWDPTTKRTTKLAGDISFANGVALNNDESWVAVVETNYARVLRHWLRGPKKGETEVLVDGLPGYPDGITRSPDGGFWLALVLPLSPLPGILGPYRWIRQLLSHCIKALFPLTKKRWGAVVKLDSNGVPKEALFDPDGSVVSSVSAATESDGRLFLGNLGGDFVSVFDL